jgi:hypothetical protein
MREHLYFTGAKSDISLKVMYIKIATQNAQVMTIWWMDSKMAE